MLKRIVTLASIFFTVMHVFLKLKSHAIVESKGLA